MSETTVEKSEPTQPIPVPAKAKGLPPMGTLFPEDIKIMGWDTPIDLNDPLDDGERINIPLDEALVLNIMTFGVTTPTIVTTRTTPASDTVTAEEAQRLSGVFCVDGRRRIRHAREANKRLKAQGADLLKVPYILKKVDAPKLVGISKSANRFRVNDGPLASARDARKMIDVHGYTVEDVALTLGVSDQTVRNWLTLLEQPAEVLEAISKQEITVTAALQLAPLAPEEKAAEVAQIQADARAGKRTTAATTRARVQARQGRPASVTSPKQRVDKAVGILTKLAGSPSKELTKEKLLDEMNKISRALTGKAFDKLGDDE